MIHDSVSNLRDRYNNVLLDQINQNWFKNMTLSTQPEIVGTEELTYSKQGTKTRAEKKHLASSNRSYNIPFPAKQEGEGNIRGLNHLSEAANG